MHYGLIAAFITLFAIIIFIGTSLVVTWRRVRQLENTLANWKDRESQGELLLHEFLAELEQAGESLLNVLDEREQTLQNLLRTIDEKTRREGLVKSKTPRPSDRMTQHDNSVQLSGGADQQQSMTRNAKPECMTGKSSPDRCCAKTEAVCGLANKGHSAEEIGRRLQVGVGEVRLILELARYRGGPAGEVER